MTARQYFAHYVLSRIEIDWMMNEYCIFHQVRSRKIALLEIAGHYEDLAIDIFSPSPIIFHKPHKLSSHYSRRVNLSGYKKVKAEEESISFEVKPEHLKNLMAFDPKTGTSAPSVLNPSEIIGIYFVAKGTNIDIDWKTQQESSKLELDRLHLKVGISPEFYYS